MTADYEPPAKPVPDESFDLVVLPHLHAAHRLARWLIRDKDDAEDAVQEASLRAFRSFRTFTGGNGRAWFLRIVRNTCYGWRTNGVRAATDSFDEEQHSGTLPAADPESLLLQTDHARLIELAMVDVRDDREVPDVALYQGRPGRYLSIMVHPAERGAQAKPRVLLSGRHATN